MRLALAMLVPALMASPAAGAVAVDLALVLAVDVSRSIDPEEAALQRDGYLQALVNDRVVRAIQNGRHGRIAVTYMEWAETLHRQVVVDWAVIENAASARAFVDRLAAMPVVSGFYTSISGAIEFALPMFEAGGFQDTRRVIDISGDGPNNNGRLVTMARDQAVAAGVTINGLPIVNDRGAPFNWGSIKDLDLYYEACVIGGPRSFIVVAENFQSFAEAIRRKLIIEIAGAVPEGGVVRVGATEPRHAFGRSGGGRLARPGPAATAVAAAGREPPPCDIGERRMMERRRGFDGQN